MTTEDQGTSTSIIEGERGRRLGTWLTGFGVVGLVLTIGMAIACLTGWASVQDTEQRLAANRLAAASALSDAGRLLGTTSGVMESTTASLEDVATALDDTARLLGGVADSTKEIAAAMDVSIFGQRPFAGVGGSFADMSKELATVSDDAAALSTTIGGNEPQLQQVAADLRGIQASVAGLAVRVQGFSGLEQTLASARVFALLSGLLATWLATLAAGCVWLGSRLRQISRIG
ncbi:MAG TPA: hypothetical protein VL687_06790 [Methylomirabilota bacterium]|nr:hypothetical protein [Methylomirabilota bacterium]